jgi:PQQ-dependent catabolism-associated beta-propeller protein
LQERFEARAKRGMRDLDFAGWLAVRMVGEAATRTKSSDIAKIREYLMSDQFQMSAYKGVGVSFRNWNGQLRQPIHLVTQETQIAARIQHTRYAWKRQARNKMHSFCERTTVKPLVLLLVFLALATPAYANDVYVSNEKDNTITVYDSNSYEIKTTIKTGKRPRSLTFSKDLKLLYVCSSDSDTIEVIDVATNKIVDHLPSGEDPEEFSFSPNGRHLFIANESQARLTVVDVVEKKIVAELEVGIEPEGVAVSPDAKTAVVTSETTSMVHWFDATTFKPTGTTLVEQRPRAAMFTADGKFLWVSSELGRVVQVIDTATKQIVKVLDFHINGVLPGYIGPVGIEITKDDKYAFIALGNANHVAVVDAKTFEVVKYILVGKRVWHVALTPENDKLFTANGISGDSTVIDVATLEPVISVKVGRLPWGVAVLPTN